MIKQLFRCFLLISSLILSQEVFSFAGQSVSQDSFQTNQLQQRRSQSQNGKFFLQASRNLEGLYLDVADINLHIEDEEEEDHQPTCKRTRTFLSSGCSSGSSIFQFSSYAGRAFSFISLPAFCSNLTCIRYIRFQVFRL